MADFKIPKGEILWVRHCDKHGAVTHVITSNQNRDVYYMYTVSDGKLTKLGRAKTPIELEKKYL